MTLGRKSQIRKGTPCGHDELEPTSEYMGSQRSTRKIFKTGSGDDTRSPRVFGQEQSEKILIEISTL